MRNAGDGDGDDYVDALRQCLTSLPARQREVVAMRYGEDATRVEMAAAFGLAEEGIKTLLRRAKANLLACVRGRLGTEDDK